MNKHLISFATIREDAGFRNIEPLNRRLIDSAKNYNFDSIQTWSRKELEETEFYKDNKFVWI